MMTVAPELPGALQLIERMVDRGVVELREPDERLLVRLSALVPQARRELDLARTGVSS